MDMECMLLRHSTAAPGSMFSDYCNLHFTGEDTETQWVKSFAQVTLCVGGTKNPSLSAFNIHAFNRHACCLSPPCNVSKRQGMGLTIGKVSVVWLLLLLMG